MRNIFKRRVPTPLYSPELLAEAKALVAAAAARLDMPPARVLEIAKAEPKGATVFAGRPPEPANAQAMLARRRRRTAKCGPKKSHGVEGKRATARG